MCPNPHLGVMLVLLASAMWGTTGTAQALAGGQLSPLWFGALRMAIAAGFFFVYARASNARLRGNEHLGTLLAAGVCMAVYNLAFFAGVRQVGVAVGTAIAIGSGPVWAGILQALVARQLPSGLWWCGTALAIAGGALMSMTGAAAAHEFSTSGIALCLLSGASYAGYTMIGKRVAHSVPAATMTLCAFTAAAVVSVPAAWFDAGLPGIRMRDFAAVLYVGIFTAGVSYLLFAHALRHISAPTAVTLALGEPVVAFVLATTLLGESPTLQAFAGLLLVVGGVLAVVRAELNAAPTSARTSA
ncbi:MAG: EamA family transporter [Burkholderiales bacterium]|nr:EamA family transporter [Burkholderiales bacterium]